MTDKSNPVYRLRLEYIDGDKVLTTVQQFDPVEYHSLTNNVVSYIVQYLREQLDQTMFPAKDYNPETGFQPQNATVVMTYNGPTVVRHYGDKP